MRREGEGGGSGRTHRAAAAPHTSRRRRRRLSREGLAVLLHVPAPLARSSAFPPQLAPAQLRDVALARPSTAGAPEALQLLSAHLARWGRAWGKAVGQGREGGAAAKTSQPATWQGDEAAAAGAARPHAVGARVVPARVQSFPQDAGRDARLKP